MRWRCSCIHPGRPVVNITGDGAFGFTLQELDTARRYGLPVVTIIHNNAAWGIIRAGQRAQLDFELGTEPRGHRLRGHRARLRLPRRNRDRAGRASAPPSRRALSSGLPSVIDCRTRFVPHPCLPAFGSMNRYGFDALTRPGNSAMR